MKKRSFLILIFLTFSFICAADNKKWVIAIEKFSYSRGQTGDAVTEATSESLPADILEKINKTLIRNVYPDEKLERERYQSRTERQSLYLQLSSEYKKRDSLLLNDYSTAKLKKSIKDEDKKIEEIKTKINKNLENIKAKEMKLESDMDKAFITEQDTEYNATELERIKQMVKRLFIKDKSLITNENIAFYKDDITVLYSPSEQDLEDGYTGYKFEKSITSAGINTLLTGRITAYGDYISVEMEMYLYPGAKKVASVMEIGTIDDMDLITTSLANQIVPYLTNSLPVEMEFSVNPVGVEKCDIYIDDVLQKTNGVGLSFQSGIHTLQFVCDGYTTAETNYYFYGNQKYKIEVDLVELRTGLLTFELKNNTPGDIIVNGLKTEKIDDKHTQIKVNGNQILGEFIAENGETAFFYVPENNYYDGSYVTINPKPFDRDKYIDTRRKWMYGSYSAFMVSLIPYFYTYGNLVNQVELYKNRNVTYEEALKWQNANNVCSGIVIACGVFWGYELVRYLISANSVLPTKAKTPKQKEENKAEE